VPWRSAISLAAACPPQRRRASRTDFWLEEISLAAVMTLSVAGVVRRTQTRSPENTLDFLFRWQPRRYCFPYGSLCAQPSTLP